MKKFNRIKKLNNKEYVYEITPYYDKKMKKIRQHSKYLGIYDGNLNNVVKKKDLSNPKSVLDYGEFLPFLECVNELKILDILKKISSHEKEILTLALNKNIKPTSLKNIKSWYEGNILFQKFVDSKLSSQNISEILKKISENDVKNKFCKEFIKSISQNKTLFYDLTSFSSYSKMLNLLEYGYNRDNNNLPQFNMSLIIEKNSEMPIYYDLYPGNIVDKNTIKNTIKKLNEMKIKYPLLILDRGFFSRDNLFDMDDNHLDFVIGATFQLKEMKKFFENNFLKINSIENLKKYNNKIIFTKDSKIKIEHEGKKINLIAHFYYDPSRADKEKNNFYEIIYSYYEILKTKKTPSQELIKEITKKYCKYFLINNNQVIYNEIEINNKLNKLGKYIIITNSPKIKWDEILIYYKGKDLAEKGFLILKNYFGSLPSNVQTEETLEGLSFIFFLALIIEMKLMQKMRKAKLLEKYSIEDLIIELHKIKLIQFEKTSIVTEMTKKQKEILELLNCCA